MNDLYFLRVNSENLKVVVKYNGAPLFYTESMSSALDHPVNIWMMPTENSVSIEAHVIDEKLPFTLRSSIFLHDSNEDIPTPKKVFFEFDSVEKGIFLDEAGGFTYTEIIEEKMPSSTKVWSIAEKLKTLGESDVERMVEIVESLNEAILSNDINAAISILDFKIEEDALSESKKKESIRKVSEEAFAYLASEKGLKSKLVSMESAAYELIAGDFLVSLTLKDGSDALILESADFEFEIPIYFAKINGDWVVAR